MTTILKARATVSVVAVFACGSEHAPTEGGTQPYYDFPSYKELKPPVGEQPEASQEPANVTGGSISREEYLANCYPKTLYPDRDGDGVAVSNDDEAVTICMHQEPFPEGYSYLVDDCDDGDPDVYYLVYGDLDGDGTFDFENTVCAGQYPPEGYAYGVGFGPWDCDDSDPTRGILLFPDNDGDGDGVSPLQCIEPGSGVEAYGEDCDDDDPNRSSRTLEVGGDGVDSNCDGEDDGPCALMPEAEPLQSLCEFDVSLVPAGLCGDCFQEIANFLLVNKGTSAVTGAVILEDWVDPAPVPFQLAPGGSVAVWVPPGAQGAGVRAALDGQDDCTPEDNDIVVPYTNCTIP